VYLQLDFERLLNHGINYGNIADQFLWDSVAISQEVPWGSGKLRTVEQKALACVHAGTSETPLRRNSKAYS
jgi:hypothetical protein